MSSVAKVAKPQLRGHLQSMIKKNLAIAFVLCTTAAIAQRFLVNDSRKAAYANFYKTYNIDKEFERMRSKGLFDSC